MSVLSSKTLGCLQRRLRNPTSPQRSWLNYVWGLVMVMGCGDLPRQAADAGASESPDANTPADAPCEDCDAAINDGCNGDDCPSSCERAAAARSNIGCEYWAVPLANVPTLAGRYDFRVVIANDNDEPVQVQIYRGADRLTRITVPSHELQDIVLPWIDSMSDGIDEGFAQSLATLNGAYRLVADLPVTMTQFNPFEYDNGRVLTVPLGARDFSLSNDASLLLPTHALTGDYIAASMVPQSSRDRIVGPAGDHFETSQWPGYFALVGIAETPTTVEVELTAAVAAEASGRFDAAAAGEILRLQLRRGEVVHVVAALPPECEEGRPGYAAEPLCAAGNPGCGTERRTCREVDYDLTGSRVHADHPIAVFGGHVCAYVPYNKQACDHLESQLPPLQTWGSRFTGAPMRDPRDRVANVVRVVAAFDNTTVMVTRPGRMPTTIQLHAGDWTQFSTAEPFQIESNAEIMAVQYMLGQTADGANQDHGDPSMIILPPREQLRLSYSFVTPTSYHTEVDGQSFALVVRPVAVDIELDGTTLMVEWNRIGDREVGIVPLSGGVHTAASSHPFGLYVYGLGVTTSYAYPAGLDLAPILLI